MQNAIDHTLFERGAQSELDKSLLVKFFFKQKPDEVATLKEGRPVFKEVEYVDIKVAGSRTGGACRPARPNDIARFPLHYEAFKKRTEMPLVGTPLAEWALMSRSLVEELAYHNVKTVEQLIDMPDVHLAKFQGLGGLKSKAVKWLEGSDETARLNQIEALENGIKDKDERINQLEELLTRLETKVENLTQPDESAKPAKKARTRRNTASQT